MKLATVRVNGERRVGAIESDRFRPARRPAIDMLAAIRDLAAFKGSLEEPGIPLAEVVFEAPIPRPHRNVICVGKNYRAHALEFGKSGFDKSAAELVPDAPIFFTKAPSSVIATGAPVVRPPGLGEQMDYEAELAVIIGRGGKRISQSAALDHVFGYTIVNDVTARDLQARHKQWFLGKSADTFCPMGPWIATADEFDLETARIRCWVNDELRQDGRTRDLIFDLPTLIATLSAAISLEPGDVIATGTPEGVGIGFKPPRFLRPGDRIRIQIDNLGELCNTVVDETSSL